MAKQKTNFKTQKELQEAILQEKARGIPDLKIKMLTIKKKEE